MKNCYSIFKICIYVLLISSVKVFTQDPIDVVYCWVDDSDQQWKELRNFYLKQTKSARYVPKSASSIARYRDHQELRYSLRSLYQYAPFVNHIYIVTMGQTPSWLIKHPKITIVDHKEIFAFEEHLPTFNSLAIESHLHRIPGLCEKYLYLNDDYFFNKEVFPEDFFTKDGVMQEVFDSKLKYKQGSIKKLSGAQVCLQNTQKFLDGIFGKKVRPYPTHCPHPFTKSYVNFIEQLYPEIFYKSSAEKFRGGEGFSITYSFLQHYGLETGMYRQSPLKERTLVIKKNAAHSLDGSLQELAEATTHFISLQDEFSPDEDISLKVIAFLKKKYPQPAPWEKLEDQSALTIGKSSQLVVE